MPLDEGDTFYPNERKVEGVTLGGEVVSKVRAQW